MTSVSAAFLVDTNVLVYALDGEEPLKQGRARELLASLEARRLACISVQVLGEFFSVITRPGGLAVPVAEAHALVNSYGQALPVLPLGRPSVAEAIHGVRRHQFSYWDALIWATAKLNNIPTVLSEDFSDGARIEGVRLRNPFAPSFALT